MCFSHSYYIFGGFAQLDFVPNEEAFVMLGEIGLILLVLEAGIDIDVTTLRLIGSRGLCIALVGTFLPVLLAHGIAWILGFRGAAALAAGCTFAPTSLGIAMNVLRRSGIVNTPVGQLIVAAAIIDDMVACKLLPSIEYFGLFSQGLSLTLFLFQNICSGFMLKLFIQWSFYRSCKPSQIQMPQPSTWLFQLSVPWASSPLVELLRYLFFRQFSIDIFLIRWENKELRGEIGCPWPSC